MNQKQHLGALGEQIAAEHALAEDCQIIGRNVRTPYGEIDLILKDCDGVLLFMEVKTRSAAGFGYPEDAVTTRKLMHMTESATWFLQQNEWEDQPFRFDIMSILYDSKKHIARNVLWIKDITAER